MSTKSRIKPLWRSLLTALVIGALVLLLPGVVGIFWLKHYAYTATPSSAEHLTAIESVAVFPIGVDPAQKLITEDPLVDWYVRQHLSINPSESRQARLIDKVLKQLAQYGWYQQLATPTSRILVIYAGERHEEVTKNFGDILRWSSEERAEFTRLVIDTVPVLAEGKFYPGRYVVSKEAAPKAVADLVLERFNAEIALRYTSEIAELVPLEDALIIASLLEREAYDFTDMRIISGIIWNRLFINMPLQLDASLQYARANMANETRWWPKVVPADKFIDSPFNTYQEKGLPPTAIANPAVESLVAALNPKATDCLFYFHDARGKFYCTENYADHVTELRRVYGLDN